MLFEDQILRRLGNEIVLLLVSICILFVYKALAWQRIRAKSRQHGCELPATYHHRDPVFGLDDAILDFNAIRTHSYINSMKDHIAKCGTTYATKGFATYKWMNSSEPRNLEAVFGPKSQDWGVAPARRKQMEPFAGLGFFNCDGTEWDKSRRLVKASLQKDIVNDLQPLQQLMDETLQRATSHGSTVDLQLLFEKLFLDSATSFIFGESMGAVTGLASADAEKFFASFEAGRFGCGIRMLFGSLANRLLAKNWLRACEETQRLADKYTDRVIAYRKEQRPFSTTGCRADTEDVLHRTLLYHMVDQTTDRNHIRGTLIQTLLAAMDSTAIVLTNIFWVLARRPDIFSAIRAEVIKIADAHGNELSSVSLGQMTYLRNVVNESMRLYPVIPAINRIALVDTVLPVGGGKNRTAPVFVPRGTQFRAHWHHLHQMPDIWGTDAGDFRPERWDVIKPSPWQFMPFGGGPRRCLGQEKAMLEIAYVVARLLLEFDRLKARDEKPWCENYALSAKNLHGCHVALFAA